WNGRRLLPEGWVTASTSRAFEVPEPLEPWDLYYGYSWWIDGDGPYYGAHGRGGQFIIVLPRQDTVVVMTRDPATPDEEFARPQELVREYVVPALD
ncbi:MAG: hypothetical protein ACRCYQ_14960, partial [Nocardioides sp.]